MVWGVSGAGDVADVGLYRSSSTGLGGGNAGSSVRTTGCGER
jgi:hypothetical protein